MALLLLHYTIWFLRELKERAVEPRGISVNYITTIAAGRGAD